MSDNTALVYLPTYSQEEVEMIYKRNFIYIAKIVDDILSIYKYKLNANEVKIRNLGVNKREYFDTICLSLFDISDTKTDLITKGIPYNLIITEMPIYKKEDKLAFTLVFNFTLPIKNETPHYLFTNRINCGLLDNEEYVEVSTRDDNFSDIIIENFKCRILEYLERTI